MRVKIIMCTESQHRWYEHQIGNEFSVEPWSLTSNHWVLKGWPSFKIKQDDCEVLPDEQPAQPEPFDLERAKAGDPVQIAVGIPVRPFVFVPEVNMFVGEIVTDERYRYQEKGAVSKKMWNLEGRVYTGFTDADQLFMAPKEPQVVTRWVNVWDEEITSYTIGCTHAFDSYDKAVSSMERSKKFYGRNYLGTFPLTITLKPKP